jgi:hypothetical protein
MRTFLRGKITLLFLTLGLLLAIPAIALADVVVNDLDNNVDTTLEEMNLTAGGTNGTAKLYVIPSSGPAFPQDTPNGCNLAGNNTDLVLNVASDNTAVAEVTSQVTIASCDLANGASISVTPKAAGTANITVSKDSSTTAPGTFTLTPASFKVNVAAPPDTTAPQVASINRSTAAATNASNVSWLVTFSESVTGVDASDFNLAKTGLGGTPAITNVTGTGSTRTVTASTGSGDGTLGLNLVDDDTIKDAANNTLVGPSSADGSFTGQVYTIDRTAPTATGSAVKGPNFAATDTYTAGDWTNKAVRVTFTCADNTGGSGISATSGNQTITPDYTAETSVSGDTATFSGTCTDNAGNTAAAATFGPIKIDKTNPLVSLVDGPANGSEHYFGSVPAAPTCDASDALSGLTAAGCVVSGYSALVGHHTVTASATDNATNTASDSHTYDVLAWTFNGFYQPVDMGGVVNTVKGGSTVPIKFELFAGPTELTSTSDVKTLKSSPIACSSLPDTVDAIELTATGGTSLRYDTTGGQFVYNWKTPTGAGTCHAVTVTAQDGSYKTAYFKLK